MKSSKEEGDQEEEDDGGGEEEEEGQKGKRFIEKLRTRAVFVGHRSVFRQPSTPAHISFDPNKPSSSSSSSKFPVSSRKLAASLWEFYQYHDQDHHHHHEIPPPAAAKMHRLRHGHGKAVAVRDNGLDLTDEQPESAGSIRRQIGRMLMKHHQLTERNDHSSYDSSLEVAPYNASVVTPGRRRRGGDEPNYNNLKTSTELLKVLNRIWTLEEQHSSNISLIKSLKTELSHSRSRIKELLRCQQDDRREMDGLVKQLAEEKLSKKETKEHDDDRASLHRKLARESKSKKILERLCDEFAKGIKSYEKEIHGLKLDKKKKKKKSWDDDGDDDEEEEEDHQMVLCIAESWLDERIQSGGDGSAALEKLEFEIESFLKSKEEKEKKKKKNLRRSSLESVPFNALSAPIQEEEEEEEEEEEDDSNCFELKKQHGSDEAEKKQRSLQVKFEDQMAKGTNNVVVGETVRTHRRIDDEASCSYPSRKRAESPIRHWNPRRAVTSDVGGVKENTLRAKLSEARNKSSRPRIRLFKS